MSKFNIIKRPLLTEKSARLRETGGATWAPAEGESVAQKVVFEVDRNATKLEIKKAVQEIFNVTVAKVHTLIVRGKVKKVGRFEGQRPSFKKAYVTLKAGDSVEFFEGV